MNELRLRAPSSNNAFVAIRFWILYLAICATTAIAIIYVERLFRLSVPLGVIVVPPLGVLLAGIVAGCPKLEYVICDNGIALAVSNRFTSHIVQRSAVKWNAWRIDQISYSKCLGSPCVDIVLPELPGDPPAVTRKSRRLRIVYRPADEEKLRGAIAVWVEAGVTLPRQSASISQSEP